VADPEALFSPSLSPVTPPMTVVEGIEGQYVQLEGIINGGVLLDRAGGLRDWTELPLSPTSGEFARLGWMSLPQLREQLTGTLRLFTRDPHGRHVGLLDLPEPRVTGSGVELGSVTVLRRGMAITALSKRVRK